MLKTLDNIVQAMQIYYALDMFGVRNGGVRRNGDIGIGSWFRGKTFLCDERVSEMRWRVRQRKGGNWQGPEQCEERRHYGDLNRDHNNNRKTMKKRRDIISKANGKIRSLKRISQIHVNVNMADCAYANSRRIRTLCLFWYKIMSLRMGDGEDENIS